MSKHRNTAAARRRAPHSHALAQAIGQALRTPRTRRRTSAAMLLAALALAAPAVQAQSTEWADRPGFDWYNAGLWTQGVPTAGADAYILTYRNESNPRIDGGNAFARDLFMATGSGLFIENNASLTNRDSNIAGLVLMDGSAWRNRHLAIGTTFTSPTALGHVLIGGGTLDAETITLGKNAGERGSLTVVLADATVTANQITVGKAGSGELNADRGAQVTADNVIVGEQQGSSGAVTVQEGGSLDVSERLVIGLAGAGVMSVNGQGTVSAAQLLIGQNAGSSGTVTVDGAGTHLESRDYAIFVGYYGEGRLTVSGGATVEGPLEFASGSPGGVAGIHIGAYEGSQGTVVVTGQGSTLTTANDLALGGRGGEGRLEILDGGTVNNYHGFLGAYELGVTGGGGSVLVQGAGSTWNNAGVFGVGYQGDGTLEIADGGTVNSAANAFVGGIAGTVGTVDVRGPGSRWNVNWDLGLGIGGGASLSVTDGGAVSADGIAMGSEVSQGEIRMDVAGAGSQVDAGSYLAVHSIGGSTLEIRDGAVVNSHEGSVGDWVISSGVYYDTGGTALIEGEGSRWNVAGSFRVGQNDGAVTVREGGVLATGDAEVGLLYGERLGGVPGTRAEIWVDGAGSAWESTGTIAVGLNDIGLLDVRNGATVSSVGGIIGRDINVEGNAGVVRIDGAGSQWNMSGPLAIGAEGRGRLEVGNQGAVEAGATVLGSHAGGVGELLVDGAGSRLNNSDLIVVGQLGQGSAIVRNSATVSSNLAVIGDSRGSRGEVTVEGDGSSWTSLGNTVVGNDGRGELTVTDGGRATSAQSMLLAQGAGSVGVVNIGTGGASGTLDAPEIAGGAGDASVNFNHKDDIDFGVRMTGSLAVNKLGGGTTTLLADNDYAGPTTIAAGTLRLGDGGNTGGIVGDVRNNATLVVDRANTFAYAGGIDGTGAVHQSGQGTTVFTGEHGYTGGTFVDAGALRIGDGGTRGSLVGNVAIAGAGAFAFDRSDSFTFDGSFSGTGLFDKYGAGTLTLTGDSAAYVGHGTLRDGGLHMLGTIGGQFDVLAGTTLSGTGTLGSVDNAGTIAPGGSIGALHMTGDFVHRDGATYNVDISPNGSSDLLDIAGTATIEGGEVYVTKATGQYAGGSRYTIVEADGGVSGTYDVLDQNLPFLDMFLSYDPNHVYLDILRNDNDFSILCPRGTFNQCQVAGALDRISKKDAITPDLQHVLSEVTTLDADAALASFDRMSGEAHASLAGIMLEGHALFGQTVTRRMAERRESEGARELQGGAWVRTYGADADLGGDGNAYGADYRLHGLAVGFDAWGTEEWLIGASANVMRVDADFRPGDKAEADAKNVSIYTGYHGQRGYVDGVVSFAWWDSDVTRAVDVASIHRTAQSDYGSNRMAIHLEAGRTYELGSNQTLQPFATFQRDVFDVQAFREHGAQDIDIVSHSQGGDRITTGLGLRWSGEFKSGEWTIAPTAQARWLHTTGDRTVQFELAYAGAPDVNYLVRGATFPKDRGLVGLGLSARKDNIDLFVDYDYQSGEAFKAHNLSAGLRYRW
ncbi:autotransporter domain-containing protein [Luteimonas sp. SX5]|uniref:Autotransporter domain-containing protein n=1 Tax=Luteimonas galliterrae TaxID=2940486 RepID=A0ABT0MF55_9GAMM|nr:autotransporter domain-containing protein [Luteimonas galliterrae]MCL1633223.1 autotransporter domain-containing protein [Luteimonas galliterrae]